MHRNPTDSNKQYAAEYLQNVEDRFFFDTADGIYKPKSYYKAEKRQRLKKFWAEFRNHWATIGINFLTLIAVICYAHYAYLQWGEGHRANDIADKALESDTRPWVGIPSMPTNVRREDPGLRFNLQLVNYGKSPAIEYAGNPVFVLVGVKIGSNRTFENFNICSQFYKQSVDWKIVSTNDIIWPK